MITTETCLTDEELAAFIDGMALPDERERVVEHLAACPRCYEIYAATLQFQQESIPEEVAKRAPLPFVPKRRIPPRLAAAVAAAAAAVLAVGGVGLHFLLGPPSLGAMALLDELPSNRGKRDKLAAQIYSDPVMRGSQEDKGLEIPSRDFQFGVRLVGLLLNLEVKGSPTDDSLRVLSRLSDQASNQDQKKLFDTAREALRNGRPQPGLKDQVLKAEEDIATSSEEGIEFRFGEWTEASRLAAIARSQAYFEKGKIRHYLRWVLKQPDVQKNAQVYAALQSIDRTLAKGPLAASDFEDLQQRFTEIIKAYEIQSDV